MGRGDGGYGSSSGEDSNGGWVWLKVTKTEVEFVIRIFFSLCWSGDKE